MGRIALDAVRPADVDIMQRLLDAGHGLVRLVTLAPECDAGLTVTQLLTKRGIVVSAGHTDASLEQLCARRLEPGLACSLTSATAARRCCPGMIISSSERSVCASNCGSPSSRTVRDVPWFVLGNVLRSAGLERCLVVTDAIAPAGLGQGQYQFGRWKLSIGADLVARSPDGSHLVGSVGTMDRSYRGLMEQVGLSSQQVGQLTWDNPQRARASRSRLPGGTFRNR